MKSATVIGLAILGVAVTGGAVAVVYVLKNKGAVGQATGQTPSPVQPAPTTKPLVLVTQENASKPPAVSNKEPSTLELINTGCGLLVDPASKPWCSLGTAVVGKFT